ncbi:MAG: anti-sigma factor [Bryobacteraceae bacterium]
MTCESFSELCELYVLGLLDDEERWAAIEHLETGCPICSKAVERALNLNAMISVSVPGAAPSPALRRRIAESFGARTEQTRAFSPWMSAAAAVLLVALVGFVDYAYWSRQFAQLARENARQNARLEQAIQILEAAGTRIVHFGGAAEPHGALFVNPQLGIVLTTAGLPETPKGWHYESWVVPRAGNPQAVGAFDPNTNGLALMTMLGPINTTSVHAIAVSVEPPGASLMKPTKVVFAAPL